MGDLGLMGVLECEADFFDEVCCFGLVYGVIKGGFSNGFCGDGCEDGVKAVVDFAEVVNGGDVLVVEIGQSFDLFLKILTSVVAG